MTEFVKKVNYVWEQRKLGDMGSTFTGLSGKTKEDFGHGDAQFITYMNVFSNPVANLEMTEAVEIDTKQNSVKKGDVFFTTSSETSEEVGMSCVMPQNKENIYLNSFCFGYRPTEKFDLDYLAYVLRAGSFRKEMTFLAQGISRYNISKNKVMGVSIPVPNLEEQAMIGEYFNDLDHLITLHQRKICIFIKKLPIDWEQRKLGEIATETYGGGTPKTSNEEFWKGDIPWIQSSDLIDECLFDVRPRKCISQEAVSKSATKLVPQNSIAIVTRVGVGKLAFMPFSYATSQDFLSLSGLKIDPEFTVYALYKMMQSVSNEVQGTSIKGVTKDELLAKKITFPSCNEQEKIGAYLHSLDHLITLHHRECVILRKMKVNDWEQRKVTDLGEIYIGLVTTMTEHYTDQGHLLIRNSDIKDGYFEFGENPIYLDEEFSEQNKSRMHQLGDVVTVHTGDIGTSAVIGENEVNSIGFATIVTRPNQEVLDSDYFATYLNTDTHKQWAISMATGDGRSNYNLKDYTKLVVPIPQIKEQKKIAACIGNLNNLITLHHRKGVILRKKKVNDWEQRKLGEITDVRDGTHDSPKYVQEGHPFITSKNVSNGFINYDDVQYVTDADYQKINRRSKVEVHDILMGMIGTIGNLALIQKEPDFAIKNVALIKYTGDVDYEYLYQALQADCVTNQLFTGMDGGTQKFVSLKKIRELDIPFPEEWEQKKIGDYFSNLDHLITLHHHEEFCTENVLIYIEINITIQIKEDIMAELESVIEQKLIDQLVYGDSQWTYRADLKTEEDLWNNFRYILEQNNKDRLNGEPLSDTEFEQVKNQLQFSSFYKAGEWLVGENGKVMVHVQRDTERLHLVVMNHEHIAGGSSVYEVINQYRALADEESQTKAQDRRFDVTLMINGLPMIHIELKNKQHSYMDGFWQIKKYIGEGKFTGIFSAVQMFVISNGVDTKYFSAASDTELNPKFISGWLDNENNPVPDYLDFAKSVLRIPEAHEMIARYTVLDEEAKRLILLRPYQIHAIEAIREASKTGKSGFVWHTTGSGKTLTSYKATRNLLMDIPSIDKAIFLIDRKDLDTQTSMAFRTYANNDLVDVDQTDNVFDLKKKLKSDDRQMIVTTIQKLQRLITKKLAEGTPEYNKIKSLKIAFVVDECHRAVTPGTKRELERFFANSLWYGFTGTPRFAENPYPQLGDLPRTTEELYGERLHRYTIQNAIHDNAVLGFQVEHNGPKNMDDETDSSMYENETHMLRVLDVILNKSYHKLGFQNGKGKTYEGLLTTSSIQLAQKYYELLKRVKNGETNLQIDEKVKQILPDFPKFAITYSVTENEEGSHLNQEKMKESIKDYNEMFGTKLDISQIQSYNANLNKRLARKEPKFQSRSEQLDLVIVVDRLLTGFDAPCMSTLFVDRQPMGPHDLIQAFSRTNRIFDKNKTYGQIVTFQAPKLFKECVDNAVKLYSAGSTEIALLAEWEEIEPAFRKALKALRVSAETPAEIPAMSEKEKVLFVKAFQNFDKLFAQLKSFTQYEDSMLTEYGISEDEYDDYAGHYLNVKEELKAGAEDTQSEMEEQPIDVDYELMAYSNTKIDYEYIINLIQNIVTPDEDVEITPEERQKQLEEVKQYIDDLRKENPKVADIMSTLVSEIEQDEVKYKGQSILNIVENMKHECIEKVVMDFSITWYVSKDDVMYAATHYRNGEIPNESAIKSTADFTSFKEAQERAIPKFKYYNMMIEELRKTLEEEIKPLLNN